MPYNASGVFTRVMNWTSDYENGIEIVCDRHDDEDDNFAGGLNLAFCRDGRATATGNFKMGSNKITGLGNGEAANDAVNLGQLSSYAKTSDLEDYVSIAGDETITGDKTFTGDVAVPTQANSDNSTKAASTAFIANKFVVTASLPATPDANTFYFIPEE